MEYISEHFYRGRRPWDPERPDLVEHVGLLRDSIRENADGHRKLQAKLGILPDGMIPIAMDEWNYWHGKAVGTDVNKLGVAPMSVALYSLDLK